MRTTITLEPDVESLLQQAMRDGDVSFKHVVNEALRKGLRPQPARRQARFVQLTFDTGRPLVDLSKAGAMAGEFEDLELLAKLAVRR